MSPRFHWSFWLLWIWCSHITDAYDLQPRSSRERSRTEVTQSFLQRSLLAGTLMIPCASSRATPISTPSQPVSVISTPLKSVHSSITKDFLQKRVQSFDATEYRPGLAQEDVMYPSWFLGKWKAASKFVDFTYPLGAEAHQGPSYNTTMKELDSVLEYVCKFKPDPTRSSDECIADRLYNVEQIALSSIGKNCILDDVQTPGANLANELHLVIRPPNIEAGTIYDIMLTTSDRVSTTPRKNVFDVLERTKQTILVQSEFQSKRLIKDIETITSYELLDSDHIKAIQRTAAFLSPEDSRYRKAVSNFPEIENTSIDVRKFVVDYVRV